MRNPKLVGSLIIIMALQSSGAFAEQDNKAIVESARITAQKGQYEQARALLKQVPMGAAYSHEALQEDVRIDYYSGKPDLAYARIETVLRTDPLNVGIRLVKAEFLRQDERFEEAEQELVKVMKVAPLLISAQNEMGMLKFAVGDFEGAVSQFGKVLSVEPANEVALLKRSQAYRQLGKSDLAVQDLKSVVNRKPSNTRLRLELADAYSKLGKSEEAFSQIMIAYKLNPESIEVVHKLADLYQRKGQMTDSIPLYEKVLLKMPAHAAASLSLGMIYAKTGDMHRSEDILTAATAAHPTDQKIAQALADVYQHSSQLSKLGGFLKNHLARNPSAAWASMRHAQLLISVEEYKAARSVLVDMHKHSGEHTLESDLALAYTLAKTRDWSDAFEILEKCDASDPRVNFNLALAAEETEKYDIAIENYKRVASSSDLYPKAKVNCSLLLEKQGKFSEAYQELVKAKPFAKELRMDVETKLSQLQSKFEGNRGVASDTMEDTEYEKPKKKRN